MTNAQYTPAIGAILKIKVGGNIVPSKYTGPTQNADYGNFEYEGHVYPRAYSRVANLNPDYTPATATVQVTTAEGPESVITADQSEDLPAFDVNTRFVFIERMVDMIVRDQEKSLVITGSGGLGKSYTVFNRLKLNDLGEADYEKVSGHMTPKALYRRLYECNGKVMVFDDCDSVLVNDTAINLLKAALDSYGHRTLCWCSEMGGRDGEIPNSFEFTGRIVFISNFSLQDIPQPVVSRALYVDVTMTQDEKIDRIVAIAPALVPDMSAEEREECIDLLKKLRYSISDLNLRTMLKVASIRKANPDSWMDMASYMITAKLNRAGR